MENVGLFDSKKCVMGSKDGGDPFKGVDWKAVGGEMQQNPNVKPTIAKRLPKKVRNIPDHYFLPRYPLSHTLLFCGACIAAGVGAGMLVETWIDKKVKEDGGVIWEFDK
ncbi:transmembrane protein, putative [Medicago truncatula]|uniref:Transmembrane protein, putative n=2 Tax=Medicago truncatula TaxID=3880 RepID=G7JFG2_MEDTR|nr:transmembrane protein, putative [Medicago truncatula]